MWPSVGSRAGGVVEHLCATCRQQAARPLSVTRSSTATGSLSPFRLRPLIYSNRRRSYSQTQPRRAVRSAPNPAPNPTSTYSQSSSQLDSSTSATSSVSGAPRPPPPSYYALFPQSLPSGPPPSGPFHIDVRSLRREFLRLQAVSHPDFHAHSKADPSARRHAQAASALINGAFRTLANPLLRAQYLLREQYGLDVAGDEAGRIAAAEEDVLDVVLEARETIEEAESEEDLLGLKEENEERISAAEDVLEQAFADGDVEKLKKEVVRLRYWVNIREGIDNWEKGKPVVLEH